MSIEIKNLNVHFKENHILKNVNLTLPEKQITCVIGPSGCGKSTLLRTLNRLYLFINLYGLLAVGCYSVIGICFMQWRK